MIVSVHETLLLLVFQMPLHLSNKHIPTDTLRTLLQTQTIPLIMLLGDVHSDIDIEESST